MGDRKVKHCFPLFFMNKKLKKFKTIGILGGMGPSASANLYQRIINLAQKKYGATQDTDYPPMIIYNLPLFGFDETGIANKKLVKKQLIHGVKKLEQAGVDFIIIACNTVHYFYQDLQATINIPILNIIEIAVNKIIKTNKKTIGLLTSETTNKLKLYQNELAKYEINSLSVNNQDQQKINKIILNVMSGTQTDKDKTILKNIINNFIQQGVKNVLLGCTELPLAIQQKDLKNIKVFNTLDIIAEKTLEKAMT